MKVLIFQFILFDFAVKGAFADTEFLSGIAPSMKAARKDPVRAIQNLG
jgi:ABC-type lipoprotein release transport system permease subunit